MLITTIIWDFDGTLFQSKDLAIELEDAYRKYLEKYKMQKIPIQTFRRLSTMYGSWSKSVSVLTYTPEIQVITAVDDSIDKLKYIHKNEEMVKMFKKLKKFKHIILTNATKTYVIKGLSKIGFSSSFDNLSPFEKIIDREDMDCLKPDQKAFKYVHEFTQLPKFRHLMIGDSYEHDILPARVYGFFAAHIREIPHILVH
jgi:HAD superfamily hydrolase (TIGR01549 family)